MHQAKRSVRSVAMCDWRNKFMALGIFRPHALFQKTKSHRLVGSGAAGACRYRHEDKLSSHGHEQRPPAPIARMQAISAHTNLTNRWPNAKRHKGMLRFRDDTLKLEAQPTVRIPKSN